VSIEQEVKSFFNRKIDSISKSKIIQATNKEKALALELIRERTNKGLDVHGKRIKKLSNRYTKRKKQMIKKGIKGATEYVAKSVPNHGRLTGKLFTDLSTKTIEIYQKKSGNDINFGNRFNIFVKSKNKRDKIAEYLRQMGRDFIGIADKNSQRGKYEQDALKRVFLKTLFPKAISNSGKVTTRYL
jgi:hypothetical protein